MKKIILLTQVVTSILFCSSVTAQDVKQLPAPYWVIESNVKTPKHSVVYFYSPDNTIMYKETVEGKKMNVNSPKIRRRLNGALKQVTMAWQKDKQMKMDALLATKIFRHNQ